MKKIIFSVLVVFSFMMTVANAGVVFHSDLSSFQASSNTTITESFTTVGPTGSGVSSFVSNGNTYTNLGAINTGNLVVGNYFSAGDNRELSGNGGENFTIDFGTPSTAIGFDVFVNNPHIPQSISIVLNGTSGILDTFNFAPQLATDFYGFTSSEAITQLTFTASNGHVHNTGIDNIRQGSAIPEPTSLALLGLGLLSFVAARKRK